MRSHWEPRADLRRSTLRLNVFKNVFWQMLMIIILVGSVLGCKEIGSSSKRGSGKNAEVSIPEAKDVTVDVGTIPKTGTIPVPPDGSSRPPAPSEVLAGEFEVLDTAVILDCVENEEFQNTTLAEYEMKTFWRKSFVEFKSDKNKFYHLKVLNRMTKMQPLTGKYITDIANSIASNTTDFIFDESKFPKNIWAPSGCKPFHVAGLTAINGEPHFLINKTRIQKLSPVNQSAVLLSLTASAYAFKNGVLDSNKARQFLHFLISDQQLSLGKIYEYLKLVNPQPLYEYPIGSNGDSIFLSYRGEYLASRGSLYRSEIFHGACGFHVASTGHTVMDAECTAEVGKYNPKIRKGKYTIFSDIDFQKSERSDSDQIIRVWDESKNVLMEMTPQELGFPSGVTSYEWPSVESQKRNYWIRPSIDFLLTYSHEVLFQKGLFSGSCQENFPILYQIEYKSGFDIKDLSEIDSDYISWCKIKYPFAAQFGGKTWQSPEGLKFEFAELSDVLGLNTQFAFVVTEEPGVPVDLELGVSSIPLKVDQIFNYYSDYRDNSDQHRTSRAREQNIISIKDKSLMPVPGLDCQVDEHIFDLYKEHIDWWVYIRKECIFVTNDGRSIFLQVVTDKNYSDEEFKKDSRLLLNSQTGAPILLHESSSARYHKHQERGAKDQVISFKFNGHWIAASEVHFNEDGNIKYFNTAAWKGSLEYFDRDENKTVRFDTYENVIPLCIDRVNNRLVDYNWYKGGCRLEEQ